MTGQGRGVGVVDNIALSTEITYRYPSYNIALYHNADQRLRLLNPKSQKEENESTNKIGGSSLVLGDRGCGTLVEPAGVCLLRDGALCPGSSDGIHDGTSEAVGPIHSRLDLFRLRPGRVNRGGGKHWFVPAKGLDRPDVRNLPRGGDCANGLHHDHWRRATGHGTIGTRHALGGHWHRSGATVVLVVRPRSGLVWTR